jgi:hypothetical protein
MIEQFKANMPVTFLNSQIRKTFIVPKDTEIFRAKTIALSGDLCDFALQVHFIQNVKPLKPFVFNRQGLVNYPGKENVYFFAEKGYRDIIIPKGHKTVTFELINAGQQLPSFILNFNCEFLENH